MEDSKLLQGRNFHNVDLTGSNFGQVQLRGSNFRSVDMEGCRFADISFKDVLIESSELSGMKINGILVSELLRVYQQAQK